METDGGVEHVADGKEEADSRDGRDGAGESGREAGGSDRECE